MCEVFSVKKVSKRLTSMPILVLPNVKESFIVYYDTSNMGLGGMLMQNGQVVAYSSRQLKNH